MKRPCNNPEIKPMQKENQTLRKRLWSLIKDFEIYCQKNDKKKIATI